MYISMLLIRLSRFKNFENFEWNSEIDENKIEDNVRIRPRFTCGQSHGGKPAMWDLIVKCDLIMTVRSADQSPTADELLDNFRTGVFECEA